MTGGSGFYRDKLTLICMGHQSCLRPCTYESDRAILRAAGRALKSGILLNSEFRCIELDILGYPGKVIIGRSGPDPTGALSKRAKYACERAYAKIGRRLCLNCQLLWAADKPRGPRIGADLQLKYPKDNWRSVRNIQAKGAVKMRRRKGVFSISDRDVHIDLDL